MDLLSSFCIHPVSLCLLVDAFNLLTFKVIIDMYDPITIFLIVLGLFSVYFLYFCLFSFSSVYCLESSFNIYCKAGLVVLNSLNFGSGRPPGEGNGNPLQHSWLEHPMDGGA